MSVPNFLRRALGSDTSAPAAGAPTAPPAAGTATNAPAGAGTNPAGPLPTPKGHRLNSNALTILAATAAMAVVSVVIFVQPSAPPPQAGDVTPPVPGNTYLDQPVRGAAGAPQSGVPTGPNPATAPVGVHGAVPGPGVGPDATYAVGATPGGAGGLAPGYETGTGYGTGYGATSASEAAYAAAMRQAARDDAAQRAAMGGTVGGDAVPMSPRQRREAAYRRALDASAADDPVEPDAGRAPVARVAADYAQTGAGGYGTPGYAPVRGEDQAEAPSPVPGVGGRHAQFLASAAQRGRAVQALSVDAAPGPYAVQAGTVIPAVLMTEINSDLPGECLAQITRDVFDSRTQRIPLIPRGAKLLCRYDDQLGAGQSRLLVAWTRVLLPDGRSIALPGLPATDQAGARGVADQVDRHTRRAFGTAAALSLISAGAQLAQPQRGSVFAAPSTGQVMAGALGQELNQVAVEMLRRDMTNQQTIRIRQGTQFNVFLNTDLVFPGPYAPAGADPQGYGAPARTASRAFGPGVGASYAPR